MDVTIDGSGNVIITGESYSDLDGNTNSGGMDLFVIKYNSSGTKQWSKLFGTSSFEGGSGIATDSSDNIYLTGNTEGGLDGQTNSGSNDIYLIKLNSSGTNQWTKLLGTSGQDRGEKVATDSSDNIYVVGATAGGLDGNTSAG